MYCPLEYVIVCCIIDLEYVFILCLEKLVGIIIDTIENISSLPVALLLFPSRQQLVLPTFPLPTIPISLPVFSLTILQRLGMSIQWRASTESGREFRVSYYYEHIPTILHLTEIFYCSKQLSDTKLTNWLRRKVASSCARRCRSAILFFRNTHRVLRKNIVAIGNNPFYLFIFGSNLAPCAVTVAPRLSVSLRTLVAGLCKMVSARRI